MTPCVQDTCAFHIVLLSGQASSLPANSFA
jgi:hypothetical protein